ncbi:kinesin-like protein KIF14 isoform X2 [Sceloporus undulatus]|uniref:kinesin-like protein KIF14 isoform X2 n=1 Tax=Sceloporus undulatus TaxID=8520 RepID=UPI001C4B5D0A|nr:kinesin-like protein KIF14 isoform X2 [Sceloporus undulatus]
MPIYTVPKQSHVSVLGGSSQKHPPEAACTRDKFRKPFTPDVLENERENSLSQSLNKTKELNRTYVLSACKKLADASLALTTGGKLTLQRRTVTSREQSRINATCNGENTQAEKRLTLQRRLRIGSTEKHKTHDTDDVRRENTTSLPAKTNSNDPPFVKTCHQSLKTCTDVKIIPDMKSHVPFNQNGSNGYRSYTPLKPKTISAGSESENRLPRSSLLTTAKPDRTPAVKQTEEWNFRKENFTVSLQSGVLKNGNLERQKTPRKGITEGIKFTPQNGSVQYVQSSTTPTVKNTTLCPEIRSYTHSSRKGRLQENTTSIQQISLLQEDTSKKNMCVKDDPFKIENSKVTVAVRVRPFSSREKNEETFQIISMSGQETVVNHPNTKQIYSFTFDFSFWSFDKSHHFASQEMVYQSLAVPLLERAFEGYNTCLFAYGQTGSGKSYTMMGFDNDEQGIIPRFCEDLFNRIEEAEIQQIAYHLEMSYFEVYNEKIHDLLVFSHENGQKKQPLRVREHPVFGPYVEDLTVNVVTSYSDIQRWLQLGNKRRATAATGMNDKSSRSHSVFTLVMTQTKTDIVEKEEREHRIISRVNLIDLAGSERCSATRTSGERLKEGASINKSLLTLGKVISALSEQNQSRTKVFIPYRESVLTWLLKESLGGNSKTTMIATVSPAARNVEETLSTLRYARQACFIVNIAKVNEDINAKLIQELKAEIEKLKLAQKNLQNVDPEKQRLYVQEITSLRMKLHQQEREMAEMQRAWKEKLEQAEKKKFEETMELQKAGITFKVDNSLPNLVNLNEDPQLSEMLLYMLKEGQTTVGRCKPNSCHDIQLSGILISDDHCIIRHVDGAVSIMPQEDAKTYVNGKCILGPTNLHHGDRIILGGDHYFRFNNPVEVHTMKRGVAVPEDGPKDFEFAKNELLAAQRAQLESEIEEARLKAKEEMMQGIQIAKEMAQEELSCQQKNYESQIKSLETQLQEESRRKQLQEMNNEMAANKIQELEKAKRDLELEVHFNKRRLEMETLAAREVLEDHAIRHAKILEALEAEKQKIAQEVRTFQQNRGNRKKAEPNWNSLKLSMMIKEANTISSKLEKHSVFCRHDAMDKENGIGPCVQVRNIRLGITTFWSMEKFEDKLAAMKEVYETNNTSKFDDIFNDPTDEWEPDFLNTSISSFSTKRRSRSLRKSKRISGCLSEVKMRIHSSYLPGSTNNLASLGSDPPESFLPSICKEFINSALDVFERTHEEEENIAQSLLERLFTIHIGVIALTKAYEQAEESQENFFVTDQAAQSCSIRITSTFEQIILLTKHWANCFRKNEEFVKIYDEIREGVKCLGGYLQLLLQAGGSDLSLVVAEAQKKIKETLKDIVKYIGHLAALSGSDLHLEVENNGDASATKKLFMSDIYDGMDAGLSHLLDCIQKTSRIMQNELLKWYPQNEVQNQIKDKAMALAKFLENIVSDCKKRGITNLLRREESIDQELKKAVRRAVELLELHHCLDQVFHMVTSSLQASCRNTSPLRYFVEKICILAGNFNTFCIPSPSSIGSADNPVQRISELLVNQNELDSVAKSLIISFELEHGQNALKLQDGGMLHIQSDGKQLERGGATNFWEQKEIPKCKLWSVPESLGPSSPNGIHWV